MTSNRRARLGRIAARMTVRVSAGMVLLMLGACASGPVPPDWTLNARGALERGADAWLDGQDRVAEAEFDRARLEAGRSAQVTAVARVELTRCAVRVASLDMTDCEAFESLRVDAAVPERAYADYLRARLPPADAGLLPPQHRVVAAGGASPASIDDPLARLIAAGVSFRRGQADAALVSMAVDTASARGWRRPLMAWLQVQARLAEQAGDAALAAQVRRRLSLIR
jgi:hypothetical protein